MKAISLICLGFLLAGASAAQTQEQPSQTPPSSRVVGYDQYNRPADMTDAAAPVQRNDLQTLTSQPETSTPAAYRTGYGAPQVYMNYPYAYSTLGEYPGGTFAYRRRVPLFGFGNVSPFGAGNFARRTPQRPFFFSPIGRQMPFGNLHH